MKWRASAASVALVLAPSMAEANPLGLDGYTGKYGATCNECHSGGTAPQVSLTGPSTLTAGQTAEYTLKVASGAAIVGMGGAASDGAEVSPGKNTKQKFAEVVHAAPLAPANNAVFSFKVKAPTYNGPITVYAVANACNNNNGSSGDRAAETLMTVTITGGSNAPPPPPPSSPVDAGAGGVPVAGGASPATSPDASPRASTSASPDGGTSGPSNAPNGYYVVEGDDAGPGLACSVQRAGRRVGPGSAPMGALAAALMLWRRRRARDATRPGT
ncbi:MAG: hypothetical protein IPG50_03775 [Myxococcales bacterium]|nr:hypothetical protein [Myxococcales bacterium]